MLCASTRSGYSPTRPDLREPTVVWPIVWVVCFAVFGAIGDWCWYGRAAEAIGETAEAKQAYREALRLEGIDGSETDAAARLEVLDSPW